MSLEFAKYTEVTKKAKEAESEKYKDYEKIFICLDVQNAWVARILVGYDEDYNKKEGSYLLERNNINEISFRSRPTDDDEAVVFMLLKLDDLSNWDMLECDSMDECLDALDDGFGIVEEN